MANKFSLKMRVVHASGQEDVSYLEIGAKRTCEKADEIARQVLIGVGYSLCVGEQRPSYRKASNDSHAVFLTIAPFHG